MTYRLRLREGEGPIADSARIPLPRRGWSSRGYEVFRTKRTFAARRVVIAGAIALLPLAACAAPAAADPAAPAPGYTQVDRDHHRDRDRDRHWDRDRDHHRDRDRHWDRGHHHGWDDPADWLRHILRGVFGSS